jgi:hypothetical protein
VRGGGEGAGLDLRDKKLAGAGGDNSGRGLTSVGADPRHPWPTAGLAVVGKAPVASSRSTQLGGGAPLLWPPPPIHLFSSNRRGEIEVGAGHDRNVEGAGMQTSGSKAA